jgi:hypothetical protein
MTPFQNCVRQSRHPTNMATVAKNRKGEWNCFPLKLLGQMDSSFAKIILWWSSGQDGRCYYLLTIPCTLSRMQGFTCLIKSYKTNMFRLFRWNTVRRRIYYLYFVVHFFLKIVLVFIFSISYWNNSPYVHVDQSIQKYILIDFFDSKKIQQTQTHCPGSVFPFANIMCFAEKQRIIFFLYTFDLTLP